MLLGLRTAVYYADDVAAARDWYSSVLGIKPYFDEPFYVGFNVSGYELGLHPEEGKTTIRGDIPVAYWGVESAEEALTELLALGARKHEDVQDVGGVSKSLRLKIHLEIFWGSLRIHTSKRRLERSL